MDALSVEAYDIAIKTHEETISARLAQLNSAIHTAKEDKQRYLLRLRTVLESGLFSSEYYMHAYPDVCQSGWDPLAHYVLGGESDGRQPNPVFSPGEYRRMNMVGLGTDYLALEHYIHEGERALLKVSSLFDPKDYLSANPTLVDFVNRPLFHYLRIGRPAGLDIRPIGQASRAPRLGNRNLRIAAYLGVKDEIEIIEQSIAHLRAIGVDYIMVCDMSSEDGTAELLEKYKADDFSILTLKNDAVSDRAEPEDSWSGHCIRRCKNAPVDWVLFLDADEFWLPATGNLKDCDALVDADFLSVERFNVVLETNGPMMPSELFPENYDRTLLFAESVPEFWKEMQKNRDLPWIMGFNSPKIMAKPSKIEGLTAGQHDIVREKATVLRRAKPNDLVIAHLPLSTEARFKRKIENVRAIYESQGIDLSLPGERWEDFRTGWHWRRWAAIGHTSAVTEEFNRNVTDSNQIARLRDYGAIRSAAEILQKGAIKGAHAARRH